jgi:hypothetical protein
MIMTMKTSPLDQDRIIQLFLLILIAIPYITTVGIPVPISPETIAFHNSILAVPDNGVILWLTDQNFALYESELKGGEIAVLKQFFNLIKDRNVKLILTTTYAEGTQIQQLILDTILEPQGYLDDVTYGEDYVILGWLPGQEASMRSLVEDTHSAAPTDHFGTPIEEIPMMDSIRSGEDFDLFGWSGYYVDAYMRQWSDYIEQYDTPAISLLTSVALGFAKPWFAKGFVTGYLAGPKQSAEFEQLTGLPGPAMAGMDAQYLATLAAIVVIIVPNIFYWSRRISGEEE